MHVSTTNNNRLLAHAELDSALFDAERRVDKIFASLRTEMALVIASGSACKVTINLAAGGTGRAEIMRYVDV